MLRTTTEVVKLLGVSKCALLRWVRKGLVLAPTSTVGSSWKLWTDKEVASALHYCSNRARSTVSVEKRFWDNVPQGKRSTECWLWNGYLVKGYGMLGRRRGEPRVYAHRLSWELANNQKIPVGMQVLHSCNTPACVNPAHLSIGTQLTNMGQAAEDGLLKRKLTQLDVRLIRSLHHYGFSQHKLAKKFRVTPNAINQIVRRLCWKWTRK